MLEWNPAFIADQLSDTAPPVRFVETVTSTNTVLREQMGASNAPQVLIAKEQTHGRGRRGRSWLSPKQAGLYLSYGHVSRLPVHALAPLGLVFAISIASALPASVRIKWPNDLVIPQGRGWAKVGGCLAELSIGGRAPHVAILGVGLNLSVASVLGPTPEQTWADVPQITDPNALVVNIVHRVQTDLAVFEADGFDAFKARWEALHVLNGQIVDVVRSDTDCVRGVAGGVDAHGQLSIATDQGVEWVNAADVSVRLS